MAGEDQRAFRLGEYCQHRGGSGAGALSVAGGVQPGRVAGSMGRPARRGARRSTHRAGAAGFIQVQGLLEMDAHHLRVVQRDGVFGDRADDGDDVHLLHAALADRAAGQAVRALGLAGEHQHGHRNRSTRRPPG